jgi:hypothetical protein
MLDKARLEGRDFVLDIDGQGARQLRIKKIPGVFIHPAALLTELKRRLKNRKTEGKNDLVQRLKSPGRNLPGPPVRLSDHQRRFKKAGEKLKAVSPGRALPAGENDRSDRKIAG